MEAELAGVNFGKEVSPAGEIFEIEELIFLDAVHGSTSLWQVWAE